MIEKTWLIKCYIVQGKFDQIVNRIGGNLREKRELESTSVQVYKCTTACNRKLMFCEEYLIHMGITHEFTKDIMVKDSRSGMKKIFEFCFPCNKNLNNFFLRLSILTKIKR